VSPGSVRPQGFLPYFSCPGPRTPPSPRWSLCQVWGSRCRSRRTHCASCRRYSGPPSSRSRDTACPPRQARRWILPHSPYACSNTSRPSRFGRRSCWVTRRAAKSSRKPLSKTRPGSWELYWSGRQPTRELQAGPRWRCVGSVPQPGSGLDKSRVWRATTDRRGSSPWAAPWTRPDDTASITHWQGCPARCSSCGGDTTGSPPLAGWRPSPSLRRRGAQSPCPRERIWFRSPTRARSPPSSKPFKAPEQEVPEGTLAALTERRIELTLTPSPRRPPSRSRAQASCRPSSWCGAIPRAPPPLRPSGRVTCPRHLNGQARPGVPDGRGG
jgi:hypothetical protein